MKQFSVILLATIVVAALFSMGCHRVITTPFHPGTLSEQQQVTLRKTFGAEAGKCGTWQQYVPDPTHPEYQPKRSLRVNIHVMNSRDSSRNFNQAEARNYMHALLDSANVQLDTNWRNWRSAENTPILRKGYRYVLTPQPNASGDDGIYFHYDDTLYYFISQGKDQNNYNRKVVDKYSIGKDSIINIFMMVHQPDSAKSKTYRASSQGIALGTALKIAGYYELKWAPQHFAPSLNHEIGHILSLAHAWTEDGCPDTPNHPNKCWQWTTEGPCNTMATDNMMDYNAYQIALTPCQLGKIHSVFADQKSPIRKCLIPVWCTRNPNYDVTIRDSMVWNSAHDLSGNLTIAKGGSLRLSCRLSMPQGSRITVAPGGKLWIDGVRLHNSCGLEWDGIFTQKTDGLKGEVFVLRPPVMEDVRAKFRGAIGAGVLLKK